MASIAMHMAIALEYRKNNKIVDFLEFMRGVKFPDLDGNQKRSNKSKTHYETSRRDETSSVKDLFVNKINLYEFLIKNKLFSDYEKGYFLHLVTDYFFFNLFIIKDCKTHEEYEKYFNIIYSDYDKINKDLEITYGIDNSDTPWFNSYLDGEPETFSREDLHKFIKFCSKINLETLSHKILHNQDDWRKVCDDIYCL